MTVRSRGFIGLSAFQMVLIFVLVAAIGYLIIPLLNVRYKASGAKDRLLVTYYASDYKADFLEKRVTSPIEATLSTLSGIESIESTTSNYSGRIHLELDEYADVSFLRFEIATALRYLYPTLPEGISFPTLSGYNEDDEVESQPILTYTLRGSVGNQALQHYLDEQFIPRLNNLDGIRSIVVNGRQDKALRMTFHKVLMDQLGVTAEDLVDLIQSRLSTSNMGVVKMPNDQKLEVIIGRPPSKDLSIHELRTSLENLSFKKGNQEYFLHQLVKFTLDEVKQRKYYRVNGQSALTLVVFAEEWANQISTAQRVQNRVDDILLSAPSDVHVELSTDHTEYLREELNKIYRRTIWSLAILFLAVFIIYWSWSTSLVVLGSLLVNLGIAFLCYYFLDVELNLYALAGITVTFGLLLDNAVVMNHQLRTLGNTKVFTAIVTATLTTLSVLLLLFFLPKELRQTLGFFGKVVIINLSISLLVARFFVPALFQILRVKRKHSVLLHDHISFLFRKYRSYALWARKRRGWLITIMILLFGLPVYLIPTKWEGQDWYNETIGSEWYTYKGRPWVNKILGGSSRLFYYYVFDKAQFREPEESRLYINCQLPEGTTLEQANALVSKMDNYLLSYLSHFKNFTTNIYDGTRARIVVTFDREEKSSFPYVLQGRIIAFATHLKGAEWGIYGLDVPYSNKKAGFPQNYIFEIKGYDRNIIDDIAQRTKQKLEKYPRIKDIQTNASLGWSQRDRYLYNLEAKTKLMSRDDLSMLAIERGLQFMNTSDRQIRLAPEMPPLLFSWGEQLDYDLWSLEHIPLEINENQHKRLGPYVQLTKNKVAHEIKRIDQEYVQLLSFSYTELSKSGKAHIKNVLEEIRSSLTLGYSINPRSRTFFFSREQKQRNYMFLCYIALSILIITAIYFESFVYPLYLLILIPLSYIGIFLIFYWTNIGFDQGGYTSFILVSGLTVNSLIYLLHDYQLARSNSETPLESYMKAMEKKFIPILLTILSTVVGLLPFVLIDSGDIFWPSLAMGAIGGLLFSLLVILLFLPAVFPLTKDYS